MASARLYPKYEPKKKSSGSFKKQDKRINKKGLRKGASTTQKEQREIKKIDNAVIVGYITLNSHYTVKDLKKKMQDPNTSVLEQSVCAMLTASALGSKDHFSFILDRLVGKVPQTVKIDKPDPFEGKSVEDLIEMKKQLEQSARDTLEAEIAFNSRVQNQIATFENNIKDVTATKEPTAEPDTTITD